MKYILYLAGILVLIFSYSACDTDGDFEIEAKYYAIRSYPGGGGIFIVKMVPVNNFSEDVVLKLEADALLNTKLSRYILTTDFPVAEITISPDESAETGEYKINLIASFSSNVKNCYLTVDIYNWSDDNIDNAVEKRDVFIEWLERIYPQFGDLIGQEWTYYMTYPEVLIVEHWTFLSAQWEMRLCYHVMIPPDDWSMVLLRRRGEVDALFAARREYNESTGTYEINEIPVSEYPLIFSY